MKKYYTTLKFKLYNKRRILYAEKHNKRTFNPKYVSKVIDKHQNYNQRLNYARIDLPNNFSFIEYPMEFIKSIKKIKACLKDGYDCQLNGRGITYLTPETIPVLKVFMDNFKKKYEREVVSGIYPTDPVIAKIWKSTGFAEIYPTYDSNNKLVTNIETHGKITYKQSKENKSDYATELINLSSKEILGYEVQLPEVWTIISELIGNTYEHSGDAFGQNEWTAAVYCDKDNGIAKFSFIDTGKGIASTMKRKFTHKLLYSNAEIIQMFFLDKLNITRTNQDNRGFGLKTIYNIYKNNKVKNLKFVFNNVYIDIENNIYKTLEGKFPGTFVYWEIDKGCMEL